MLRRLLCASLIASGALVGFTLEARASDHLDAPALSDPIATGDRDINDLYVFASPNPNNTVLILTVNPLAGAPGGSGTAFNPAVSYQFQIDNTGEAVADITYSATFSPVAGGSQAFTLTRDDGTGPILRGSGATETTIGLAGGGFLRAGVFDDPFFFDLNGFNAVVAGSGGFTGDDFFAGANVSAIVLEIPTVELEGTSLNIWARTELGGMQVDRVGRPAINTALIPSDMKDDFNAGIPSDDVAEFSDEVSASITAFSDAANAAALTPALLPDVLTYDTTMPTDFFNPTTGALNGRTLADDVIDDELGLLTAGGLTSDGVDANDVDFRSIFPYLADANVIPEPASVALLCIGVIGGTLLVRSRRRR